MLTTQDRAEILESYRRSEDKPKKITILAQLYGVRTSKIKAMLYEAGELTQEELTASETNSSRYKKWTDAECQLLIELRSAGLPFSEIHKRFPDRHPEGIGVKCRSIMKK